jgi:prophage antirepressor-like protein
MNTTTEKTALVPFLFDESTVRTTVLEGQPWFVGKDVCAALGIRNNRDALEGLDDDEKGVATTDTPGGKQNLGVVNESGLYALIFRSRKEEARRFRKWVTSEVLPAIRKRGYYDPRQEKVLSFVRDLLAAGLSPRDAAMLARNEFPAITPAQQRKADFPLPQPGQQEAPLPIGQLDMILLLTHIVDTATGPSSVIEHRFDALVTAARSQCLFPWLIKGQPAIRDGKETFVLSPEPRRTFSHLILTFTGRIFTLEDGRRVQFSTRGKNRGRWYQVILQGKDTAPIPFRRTVTTP